MSELEHQLVLEVLEGCGPGARAEASALGPVGTVSPTELTLRTADLDAVRGLRRVVAAYGTVTVPARRPRELLETSVLQRVTALWEDMSRQRPRQRFHGVRLAAAGADTADMRRIAEAVSQITGLPVDEEGDLLLRVRRGPGGSEPTWQLLLRTTPRPLATRAWRTVNYPGAVNATIAASVLDLLDIGRKDELLDMTCGSGTFLIEQLHEVPPARAVGVDLDPAAIEAAEEHQRAARRRGRIDWVRGDVLTVPLDGSYTRLITNPPWGMLHGEHATTEQFHADLLRRADELAAPGAVLGVLTHEIRRMHHVLKAGSGTAGPGAGQPWRLQGEHRFFQKGHHPRLFLLRR